MRAALRRADRGLRRELLSTSMRITTVHLCLSSAAMVVLSGHATAHVTRQC